MNSLMSLSFKVYSSIETSRGHTYLCDMIAIEAKVREYPAESTYLMPKEKREEEENKGLYNISFYMTREEFETIVKSQGGSANDIGHNLRAMGELWTFYDLDFPSRVSGVMRVPYYNMSFPIFCQRLILKAAKGIWKANKLAFNAFDTTKELSYEQKDAIQERHSIDISQAKRNRWSKLYGCGKGNVEVLTDEKTQIALANDDGDEKFDTMYDRVKTIAQNSTYAYFQTAKLRINVEYGGKEYGWAAYRPSNSMIMNGAIVDHSREEGKHDWSIHT